MMKQPNEDIPLDPSTLIRIGVVKSVDHGTAKCVVRYGDPDDEDGGAETPPIRWAHARAGGTRTWSPVSVGEQVLLLSPDGQFGNAVAIGGITQDSAPAPGSDETELILFKDGARIAYDPNAHALSAILPDGATAHIEAPGGLSIKGPVSIEGDVTITGKATASDDVVASGVSLKNHVHSGVQAGGAQSGKPVAG